MIIKVHLIFLILVKKACYLNERHSMILAGLCVCEAIESDKKINPG